MKHLNFFQSNCKPKPTTLYTKNRSKIKNLPNQFSALLNHFPTVLFPIKQRNAVIKNHIFNGILSKCEFFITCESVTKLKEDAVCFFISVKQ